MNIASYAAKLLTNKYVLYFVVFLAVTNILGYLMIGQFRTIIFFALVSLLTSYFSNNMIVILLVGLLLTNLFVSGSLIQYSAVANTKEGMQNETISKTEITVIPDMEDDEEKLGDVDEQLKKGIDVLRQMKGDVSKAKKVLEDQESTMATIKSVIGDEIKDPNNPTMNKQIKDQIELDSYSEISTTKSAQGFKNISGSVFR